MPWPHAPGPSGSGNGSWRASILVRAVRADADDVLQDELVVGSGPRAVEIVLQAEAAELAGREIDHGAVASRGRAEIVERGAGEERTQGRRVHLIVAQPEPPLRHELVNALHVA